MRRMKRSQLNSEEENLLCIYTAETRKQAIQNLEEMKNHLEWDEVELMELTSSTITKLTTMSDKDYEALRLAPEF